MAQRPNPLAYSTIQQVQLGNNQYEEEIFLDNLILEALSADNDRDSWMERQKALTKLRFSIRPRIVEYPWRGASNLGIPFIDATIRKWKPTIMRLFTEPDPVVEFQGDNPEAVEAEHLAEEFYNWLFKIHMDSLEPLAYIVDTLAHRGFAFAQVGWDYRTEFECRSLSTATLARKLGTDPQQLTQAPPDQLAQILIAEYGIDPGAPGVTPRLQQAIAQIQAGAPVIKVAFRKVIRDRPAIWDRDPVQVIMPPRATDVDDAEWVVVQHVLTMRRIEQMEADGFFRRGSAETIREHLKSRTMQRGKEQAVGEGFGSVGNSLAQQEQDLQDTRERIFGEEDENNVLVWQIYHWKDIDGDKLADRVETWVHPPTRHRLSSRPFLFPFHQWPIVKFDFEKVNRRWHSPRGISQMLEGLQREVNHQHNARIDGMLLRNSGVYQTQVTGGFKARNWRMVPGTVLSLPAGQRIEPIAQDRGPWPEQVNEENLLRGIGEGYIGTLDSVISGPQSSQSARTATEVAAATQFAAATASLDATLFQMAMRKLHTLIWKLYLDLGPEEAFIRVTGDKSPVPTPQSVRKAEIDQEFTLVPTGTLHNTNRALEMAHAREAMQIYLNDESGFVDPFELRRWHLNLLTYRWARRILRSPEQAQELQMLRQAAAELQKNPELQAALQGGVTNVPGEQADKQQMEFLPRDTQSLGG